MNKKIPYRAEKIAFLERALEVAENNRNLIEMAGDRGKTIFADGFLDERGYVTMFIDSNRKIGFRTYANFQEGLKKELYSPEEVVESVFRYIPKDYEEFKKSFHFYKDKKGKIDLFNGIR